MNKQVASKKFILLSLDSYNDLIVNSSISEKTSAKKEIREAILVRNKPNSQVAAQQSVSSALFDGDTSTAPSPPPENDQTSEEEQNKFISDQLAESVFDNLAATGLSSSKIERSKRIIKQLSRTSKVVLDMSSGAIVLNSDTAGEANACLRSSSSLIDFLTNLQNPNKKKLSNKDLAIVRETSLSPHLIANKFAKKSASHVLAASTGTASSSVETQWISMFDS